MRQAILLASRVKPSTWAHATSLTYAPRHGLLRSCTLKSYASVQHRLFQTSNSLNTPEAPARKEQVSEDGSVNGSAKEPHLNTELDSPNETSVNKPVKDLNWVFNYTGDRIESIHGKSIKGIEEYVTHRTGTKLLCSWTVGPGNEQNIWIPGEAPRVRDMKVPVDLKPEAVCEQTNSDWTLGSPQASFEPFFASLASMNPNTNLDNTDVIAWSSTLNVLLGVVRGNLRPVGVSTSAAFHITLINNTILIKRLQFSSKEGNSLGRGMTPTLTGSFMNKITEMKASEEKMPPDHSQAVRYDLAHLRCVVIRPVDAATGNASLPQLIMAKKPVPQGSVNVKRAGQGTPPSAVAKIMTGRVGSEANERRLNYKGQLRIKPPGQAKIWFERPKTLIQGHLEPPSTSSGGSVETARLCRVSVRETGAMLDQTEDACQLELRQLVALLDRLRNAARRAGGSCILTCLPPRENKSGGAKLPAKFELYKCGPEAERLVLDWHVERFWSKK